MKKRVWRAVQCCVAIGFLGSCSGADEPAPGAASRDPHVLDTQVQALEKARGVGQTLSTAADAERKAIESQTP